ncbi:anaerobic ribonucleoside triphosphate reductase [Granulimonas faecalis]|uniref:Anaerobic ribonucleoside triphosphate reductase n=1 Tax=Granulimonas faecalis TaxID=2894155 RepID=A0AAV5B7F6_9ACTN|nr:anaerobic ribonucleoside-triphosphate reductase [Granulimonas faecalis]GJM56200.1 anaerobic ribonucleoside triphosphate reductase [Granulimonas faecalis]
MKIIKRDGTEQAFDRSKIEAAIRGANGDVAEADRISDLQVRITCDAVCAVVQNRFEMEGRVPEVEEVQDLIEDQFMLLNRFELARAFERYRHRRELARRANTTDDAVLSLLALANEEAKGENANKDPVLISTQRDYMAGEVSRDITRRILLPEEVSRAHDEGVIHFHDADYFAQNSYNCELVNLEDMLQNGTVISETRIEKPHSFSTACNIATQIIAQVASNTYGGQTLSLAHLSPFVEVSRRRIRERVRSELSDAGVRASDDQVASIVSERLADEVTRGVQTIQYQILTLLTTNGQTPFVSLNLDLGEVPEGPERDDLAMVVAEVLRQRIQGVQNEAGAWITPAFPKLLYVLDDHNVGEGAPYGWLTRLAAECTARRMVPDYISAKVMRREKGDVYPCMGCRSFLTPDRFSETTGDPSGALTASAHPRKYYGRFNQGVVTVNLPDVALSAAGDEGRFWEILDERLELCHRALRIRHEHLLGTPSDVAPILWQHGAIARLPRHAVIDPLLYGGYSTISLGYAGLHECCVAMFGRGHTDPAVTPFALAVMERLNDRCAQWKAAEDIDYSVYGTPLESTTYKFARCLRRRFGVVEGVTDHDYITNSYHVNVREQIDAFAKLAFESDFQRLSPGGAISYVEVPDMKGNVEAVMALISFIHDHIMYAELNTKSDYCQECGYDGEVAVVEEDGRLLWECPRCGNRDQSTLNVARRTCGYIGTQFWNQGRTEEIRDRVLHL